MPAYGRRANVLEHEGIAIVKTLKLADGRCLAYAEYGDPDGTPVVFNGQLAHSRLIRQPDDAVTASLGVCVIAADQPRLGGSSPQPGRRIVDWGKDIEELVDALELGTFNAAVTRAAHPTRSRSPIGYPSVSARSRSRHRSRRSTSPA